VSVVGLESDPRQVASETLVNEVNKLDRVLSLELSAELPSDVSEKSVEPLRARTAALLTTLWTCWSRAAEDRDLRGAPR
jgi:hypothetical protein